MAVTFLNTTTLNADGLAIAYGTEESRAAKGGEYRQEGSLRCIEFVISDMTALSATQTDAKILDRNIFLPKGAFVRRVVIDVTTTTTTGSNSLFNLGTVKKDGTTEGDFNGFIDSLDIDTVNAGGRYEIIVGSTGAGALLGVTSGTDSGGYYICASSETAVFTAGAIKVSLWYDFNNA